MTVQKTILSVAAAAIILHGCTTVPDGRVNSARDANGYVNSADAIVMVDGSGECVRSIAWSSENVAVECEASNKPAKLSYNSRALFDFDSAALTAAGKVELQKLIARLRMSKAKGAISVVGHADSTGTDVYNQGLSERRATTVHRYLERALSGVQVKARGMGESAPVADNATEAGRRLNRRVEVDMVPAAML